MGHLYLHVWDNFALSYGKARNPDVEAQLAKYCGAAAIPLRHIDQELAITCEDKADFWTGPEDWNNEKIARLGIKLEDASAAYRRHRDANVFGRTSCGPELVGLRRREDDRVE